MISKSDLKINGEHSALGREFDMVEFKGYTISELSNIKGLLKEMKDDYIRETKEFRESCVSHRKEIFEDIKANRKEISDLNAFKNKVLAIAAVVGLAAGTIGNWILGFFR